MAASGLDRRHPSFDEEAILSEIAHIATSPLPDHGIVCNGVAHLDQHVGDERSQRVSNEAPRALAKGRWMNLGVAPARATNRWEMAIRAR